MRIVLSELVNFEHGARQPGCGLHSFEIGQLRGICKLRDFRRLARGKLRGRRHGRQDKGKRQTS